MFGQFIPILRPIVKEEKKYIGLTFLFLAELWSQNRVNIAASKRTVNLIELIILLL